MAHTRVQYIRWGTSSYHWNHATCCTHMAWLPLATNFTFPYNVLSLPWSWWKNKIPILFLCYYQTSISLPLEIPLNLISKLIPASALRAHYSRMALSSKAFTAFAASPCILMADSLLPFKTRNRLSMSLDKHWSNCFEHRWVQIEREITLRVKQSVDCGQIF